MKTSSWGNFPVSDSEIIHFERRDQLPSFSDFASIIPKGLGRCYGDSATQDTILLTTQHNKILNFEETSGTVTCQSGVSLDELIQVFLPRGWFLPVSPGTKFVTVGGAIASDVHGKNHHKEGSFSQHLISFELLLEDGRILSVDRNNPEVFWATCGGMGLTGLILTATFKLKKVESAYIDQVTYKAKNLEEAISLFEATANYTYSMAWVDCLGKGNQIGRSVVMVGEHTLEKNLSTSHLSQKWKLHQAPTLNIPFYFPEFVLNKWSVAAFNFLYYNKNFKQKSESQIHYNGFFYPLDAIMNWNRMYGKSGFTQYQLVVPKSEGPIALPKILKQVEKSGMASFLAVLKAFGPEEGIISFPFEGYTLTLDFAIKPSLFPFLNVLDQIVLEHGGRLYLTKDVRMSSEMFFKTYPNAENFKDICRKLNPKSTFRSVQSDRLKITPW